MKYFIVDAFTDQPFGGNPAGVVLLDSDAFPKEELMLQIAAELRYSETAFVKRHSAQEFSIRYFTPKAEVELCGHETVASFCLRSFAAVCVMKVSRFPLFPPFPLWRIWRKWRISSLKKNETIALGVVNEVVKKASTLTANGDPR